MYDSEAAHSSYLSLDCPEAQGCGHLLLTFESLYLATKERITNPIQRQR